MMNYVHINLPVNAMLSLHIVSVEILRVRKLFQHPLMIFKSETII